MSHASPVPGRPGVSAMLDQLSFQGTGDPHPPGCRHRDPGRLLGSGPEAPMRGSPPHRPERTCVGCRRTAPREQLVRLVREPAPAGTAPRLRVDPRKVAPGRGAWLHPDASCLDLALRRGGLARSFRGPVDAATLVEQLEAFEPTIQWK